MTGSAPGRLPLPLQPLVAVGPTWSSLPDVPRAAPKPSASVNGKFYLFGGYTSLTVISPTNEVHAYDPTTNTWTRLHNMPVGLTDAGVAVVGQYIYFAGDPPNARHTFQIYGTTMVWRTTPRATPGRRCRLCRRPAGPEP